MLLRVLSVMLVFVLWMALPAMAQLPPDAVLLDKVKVTEKYKSDQFCPIYFVPVEDGPAWEYKGVKYKGSKPDAQEKFMKDADAAAKEAEKQRFMRNFMEGLSTVWCPVTDEITPGGMTQWTREGLTYESCCTFCDENFKEEDFKTAKEKLKGRAEESYKKMGAKYSVGHKSPVEGAIKEELAN